MMRAAEAQGARLRLGQVTGIVRDGRGSRVRGVEVDGETIEGDAVVIAMGPWSILAAQWLPLPPVFGLKGHSLVFDTGTKVPAEALFLEYQEASGEVHGPEVFPRDRWHHLRLRHLQREPAAGRSRATWRPIPARSSGCRPCAPGCRRRSGKRRCWPARPAIAR